MAPVAMLLSSSRCHTCRPVATLARANASRLRTCIRPRAEENGTAQVSEEPKKEEPKKERKAAPLARGGNKVAVAPAASPKGPVMQLTEEGKFKDYRWENGRWTLSLFENAEGKMDLDSWNKVIDAEMARRKLLEDNPIPSTNEDPVLFDTAEIPWYAWVIRFHLPEAEKLNGRACMVGYILAALVDGLSGAGLVEQQESFLGKLALHIVVFGVLLFRTSGALPTYKGLLEEATFYDKQWSAAWEGKTRPAETET